MWRAEQKRDCGICRPDRLPRAALCCAVRVNGRRPPLAPVFGSYEKSNAQESRPLAKLLWRSEGLAELALPALRVPRRWFESFQQSGGACKAPRDDANCCIKGGGLGPPSAPIREASHPNFKFQEDRDRQGRRLPQVRQGPGAATTAVDLPVGLFAARHTANGLRGTPARPPCQPGRRPQLATACTRSGAANPFLRADAGA